MWDERYQGDAYLYGKEPNDFLREMAERIPQGRVLCLADGEGRNGVYLAALGYEVISVDSSKVGLQKAERLAHECKVSITTVVSDLSDFEIEPNNYTGIVSIFCHLPPAQRAALYTRCVQGLSVGGVMLIESYTPQQQAYGTGGPPDSQRLVSLDTLKQELKGLLFEHACECERTISEGRGHQGKSAVVQVLATKRS